MSHAKYALDNELTHFIGVQPIASAGRSFCLGDSFGVGLIVPTTKLLSSISG